ncbi:hypothetical protein FHT44_005166 [Mycolicibacterium sp. BK634]|nr:hypothetical protein [Mycolicibacterium sp. BK634]
MAMPPIDDMETAEAVARVHYDAYEWSGCNGSRWERVPADARKALVRTAAEWIACMREVKT